MTFIFQGSRSSFTFNVLLHALLLLLLVLSTLAVWLKLLLALSTIYSGIAIHRQYILKRGRSAIIALRRTEQDWLITMADGIELPVQWQTGSVVNALFIALCWQHTESKRHGYLYCPRDSLDNEHYRHLCRLLWTEKSVE